jgi:chorismate mutase / prephenate dehydratase
MSTPPQASPDLAHLRVQIDDIDQQLLDLLNRRARVAEQVGEGKKREGTPFFRPDRVAQVIQKIESANPGPLKNAHVSAIWREIMSACLALESPQRVAVLGPAGTFCEEAAIQYFGGAADLMYCNSFAERSLDMFLHTPCHVVGEVSLLVRHNLLRSTNTTEGIKVVAAHPQALAQCQGWLSKHLPHAERRPVSSNAEGARLAALHPDIAGLASERAAQQFGLHVVAHAIQDDAYNRTRFAVICLPHTLATPAPSGQDCTSIIISVPNRPGAVHDLLVPLKRHGVSMTRFESRPARTGQWEYYFYIDLEGHPAQPNVASALQELRELCAFYKVLGTYPVSK